MAKGSLNIDINPKEVIEYLQGMQELYDSLDDAVEKINSAALDKQVWEGAAQEAYDEKREALISDINALKAKIQKTESDMNNTMNVVINTDGSVALEGKKIAESLDVGNAASSNWAQSGASGN